MANLQGLVTLEGPNIDTIFGPGQHLQTSEHGEIALLHFQENRYKASLPRYSDIIELLSLNVECINPAEPINIKDVSLVIGGNETIYIPFSLLTVFSRHQIVGNTQMYIFDFPALVNKIPMKRLDFHDCKLVVNVSDNSNINGLTVSYRGTFMGTVERNDFRNAPSRNDIYQYYETIHVTNPTNALKFRVNTPFNNLCKGYILEGPVKHIKRIAYRMNGMTLFDYKETGIALFAQMLSDTMLYVPFNKDAPLKSNEISSFRGGINHSRIDDLQIYMELGEPGQFSIHAVCANILRTVSGMGVPYLDSDTELMHGKPSVPVNTLPLTDSGFIPMPVLPSATTGPLVQPIVWTSENKVINPQRNTCPILYDVIDNGANYCTCNVCHHNFSEAALKQHLTGNQKNCPMCRQRWTRFVVYKNVAA